VPWHLDPIVWTARHYDSPDGHERWDEFNAVATIQALGEGRVLLSGLHGEMTREMRQELEQALRQFGFTELQAWRKRKLLTWR